MTGKHTALRSLKNPLLALTSPHHDPLNIAYNNQFDEYLIFPIVEQQFNFRISLCHRYSLSLINEYAKTIEPSELTLKQNPVHIKLANDCADYLKKNIGKNHTLSNLAKTLCTNRNSLAIAFKTVYGCGVFTWLRQQRLLMARKKLCLNSANIQTIAYQLGFSDPANFSRVYKQEFGVSPRKTRDMVITVDEGFEEDISK